MTIRCVTGPGPVPFGTSGGATGADGAFQLSDGAGGFKASQSEDDGVSGALYMLAGVVSLFGTGSAGVLIDGETLTLTSEGGDMTIVMDGIADTLALTNKNGTVTLDAAGDLIINGSTYAPAGAQQWQAGTVTAIGGSLTNIGGTLSAATKAAGPALYGNAGTASAQFVAQSLDATMSFTQTGTTAAGTIGINTGHVNTWTAAQRGAPVTLASAATITPDFATGNNFVCTITQNATLALPTNLVKGQSGQIEIHNGTTAAFTLAINAGYMQPGGGAITITATAAATDILSYYVLNNGSQLAVSPLLKIS